MSDGFDHDLRSVQEVRDLVARAHAACKEVAGYDQARIDSLCRAMAEAGAAAAHDLARLAVEETGIGRIHYKVQKNLFASEGIWASIAGEKTVGILTRDRATGVVEVATPVGVIACIIPTTNPTSTALGKALIAVKGRNAVVISPHPRSRRCIHESAEVLRRAIQRAGGPPDLVCCLSNPTVESTGVLMKHREVAMILATGGAGLVTAAYSSGKPAYGVGPGNVPAYVDRSADVAEAARWIVASQSFDNATLCCSEQGVILDRPIRDRFLEEIRARGGHLCSAEETALLAGLCNRDGHMNADVVGLDPWRLAEMAGFSVARSTSVLLAPQAGVGRDHPLSIEILAPILSLHEVDGWEEGCRTCMDMLHFGGLGHTLSVWAREESILDAFYLEKPANRIIVNGPSSQGAVGYSTGLVPSMSLGCGPQAGNITSDNITARHLINIKRASSPLGDWPSIYERDHRRAAEFTGDLSPRGSGLPGDPALASSAQRPTPGGSTSGWSGNPASASPPPVLAAAPRIVVGATPRTPRPSASAARPARAGAAAAGGALASATVPRAKVRTALKARPAAAAPPAPAALGAPAPPQGGVHVGGALSSREIRDLMAGAGGGCPLGPCRGCPHNDVRTGGCTA